MSKTLHYDFAGDKSLTAKVGPALGITRTTEATYFDASGVRQTAGSGVARFDHRPVSPFTSLGLLVEEARTNLFLNSDVPVTQNITTTAQDYTVTVEGSGTVTLSGTATGVASEGSPLTVTATAGTLTCTVAGGPDTVQVEAGLFGTSYIPTVGATVTRNADDVLTTDVTWYGADGGTMYVRAVRVDILTGHLYAISDGSNNNRVYAQLQTGGLIDARISTAGAAVVDIAADSASANVEFQSVFGWAVDDAQHYVDGSAGTPDSSLALPTGIVRLNVGQRQNGSVRLNGHIAELVYFDERLDNDTLEDYSINGVPAERNDFYIAITRRTAKQMNVKQRMAKPKPSLRDL